MVPVGGIPGAEEQWGKAARLAEGRAPASLACAGSARAEEVVLRLGNRPAKFVVGGAGGELLEMHFVDVKVRGTASAGRESRRVFKITRTIERSECSNCEHGARRVFRCVCTR